MVVVEVPRKATAAEVLVLVSRVRQAQIDAGTLDASRLFDVRVFKCVAAELAYYRRLAHGRVRSAHVATSMPQLVAGLAKLHPGWRMSGDAFADRDRHHSAVRRRLRVMAACGLLTWQAGVNLEGEEARTELLLLEPPAVTAAELKAARAQLRRWRAQYGHALNTGSQTGIRDVTKAAAEPSRAERQMRARHRAQRLRAARVRGVALGAKTAPPFGPALCFAEEQNIRPGAGFADTSPDCTALLRNLSNITGACGPATGARRAHARSFDFSPGAVEAQRNYLTEEKIGRSAGDLGAVAGAVEGVAGRSAVEMGEELERRVAARLADADFMQRLLDEQFREHEVTAAIAQGATRRAHELAQSALDRAWPDGRVKEAWLVARNGADAAARGGGALFALEPARRVQLERVLVRYERHALERPAGWPPTAWAAFLHAAAEWGHRFPAGTIEGLDQLSARMRARDTTDDLQRLAARRRKAEGRRLTSDTGPLSFRALPDAGGRWPAWVKLDANGSPVIEAAHYEPAPPTTGTGRKLAPADVWVQERLAVHPGHPWLPPADSAHRQLVERDAFLLAGRPMPARVDGRRMMRERHAGHEDLSGYEPTARVDAEILELARLEALTVRQVLQLSDTLRQDMLTCARARAARRQSAERHNFQDQLARVPGDQS